MANARSITNYPSIPGVDNYDDLYAMEGPAFNTWKRGIYYYTPYYDRTSNPPPNAPPPLSFSAPRGLEGQRAR